MTLRILEDPQAPHVDSNWYEAYRLQPTKEEVGQRTASILARALAWLGSSQGKIRWVCQVVRALPQEGAPSVGADQVVRARQLLLGVESNLDDHSTTAPATCRGVNDRTWTRAARQQAYSLIQRGWHALKRTREQDRLRDTLYRLSDRELADMGIHRGEIEHVVGTHRSDAEYLVLRPF